MQRRHNQFCASAGGACLKLALIMLTALVALCASGQLPPRTAAGTTAAAAYFIAPDGDDTHAGTREQPFASLERARDAVRALKSRRALPEGGVTVYLRGGVYQRSASFELATTDSGSKTAPIVYCAYGQEQVTLTGGPSFALADFQAVDDPAILARLPENARGNVQQLDLRGKGISEFGQMPLYGHSMHALSAYTRYKTGTPAPELFCAGKVMSLARWPNQDYAHIDKVVELGSVVRNWDDNLKGQVPKFGIGAGTEAYVPLEARPDPPHGFAIGIDSDRPTRWTTAEDAWLYGFWYWNWSDQSARLQSVDAASGVLRSLHPSCYGVKQGQPFYVYNLLEEIDVPGEWYLNRSTGILYFWPPDVQPEATVQISLLTQPMVTIADAANIRFENLTFAGTRGSAIEIHGGSDNLILACTIRDLAGNAIRVDGGRNHVVRDCTIHTIGARGIILTGGDRQSLTPGGHAAVNNHIYNFSRIVQTYAPAIALGGVGNRAAHNTIHDAPHTAVMFSGNDHVIEYNRIHHVMQNATDMGAIYAGRSHTMWGNVIRYNYFHDIETRIEHGHNGGHARLVHAIYLDDTLSGITITGNIFARVKEALAASGSDIVFTNNILLDCKSAVWFKSQQTWSREYGDYESEQDRAKRSAGTIGQDIAAMPYRSVLWRGRYPNLLTALEKTYGPQRCVLENNVLVNTPSAEGVGMSHLAYTTVKDNMYVNQAILDTGVVRNNLVVRPNAIWERWATAEFAKRHGGGPFTIDNQLVTDQAPGFVDPAKHDYRLRDDSVILQLLSGFQPPPFAKMGQLQ